MPLDAVLRAQMGRPPGYSPGLVSRLSGVPKATIVNWLEGRVTRPRRWQDLARIADAMRLDLDGVEALLAAGGHGSLTELLRSAGDDDLVLLAAWVPAVRTGSTAVAPLPAVATPFLGRHVERAAVSTLVANPDVRVVTLTGVGGAGKTRLAIEVARDVAQMFRDGVAYVALAPLTDPELVPDVIDQALGVSRGEVRSRDALAARQQLVVLDNFEHLLPALPSLAEILAIAPDITMLVTSRSVLRLYGEHQFEVPPLPLPDDRDIDVASVGTNPAIELFCQRARAVDPSFRLHDENVAAVVQICRRLDGLPLAIELAAARTPVLGPEGLLARLATSLGLLTWGARDLPGRHQSLQATLDWSLDQVDERARRLFAQLSVFMTGSRLDGAEAVAPPLGPDEVVDALMALVEHSLLRTVSVGDDTRFVMLETVRAYASSLLSDDEDHVTHERALQFVVELASAVQREARGSQLAALLDRADEEVENIRALLRWSLDHDETAAAAQVAASLLPFWLQRGGLAEGERWLDRALDQERCLPPELVADCLYAAAQLAKERGDIIRAEQRMRQSLAVWARVGDRPGQARALGGLGVLAYDRGDLEESAALHAESLTILRRSDDPIATAIALMNLGEIAGRRGKHVEAVTLQEEAAKLFAAAGDAHGEAAAREKLAASQAALDPPTNTPP